MSQKRYWKNLDELRGGAEILDRAKDEFPEPLDHSISRRTFIELVGFSAAAVALNGCRAPEQKIIPYVKQPVELTPGVANWYASTCNGCSASCGVLVKVIDGRPIKLEGNPEHHLSKGGLCALAHGLVFSLYDSDRLRQPLINGKAASWEGLDNQVKQKLASIKQSGGKVRVLSPVITSPTTRATIATFLSEFADGKRVTYRAVSSSAISDAHRRSHQSAGLPSYHFDRARLVVSFDADFLGTWIAPAHFTRGYSQARNLRNGRREMLRHIQFESRMSLTGSNADQRIKVSPAEGIDALLYLANLVIANGNGGFQQRLDQRIRQSVEKLADELQRHRGESLVVCGWNDVDAQYLVNAVNHALGNYGHTLDLDIAADQTQDSDQQMVELVREMNAGQVAALIIADVNPAYNYYASEDFIRAMSKVPLKVSLNSTLDETSSLADYVCPQHHFLEAWGDSEPARGVYSLTQPTIAPLFNTRAYQENFMRWRGDQRTYYDVLRAGWREKLFPLQQKYANFDEFWDHSLHDGVFVVEDQPKQPPVFAGSELNGSVDKLAARSANFAGKLSLALYEKVSLRDGAHANNPWLQELPDPITRITWDNYVNVSLKLAERLQLEEGQVVSISKGATTIELPVHIQPGQHDDCISMALGYGRTKAGKVGSNIGENAFPLVSYENGSFQYLTTEIKLEKLAERVEFAKTQVQDNHEGRGIIKELVLAEYLSGHNGKEGEEPYARHKSIWPGYEYTEHKWGMVVDLNACTGCSACILSCQAENNVPVVGKDEVRRRREMHWIRIDRYYEGSPDDPKVTYQPVMCEHCDNASCESVCPVLATVHSSDGLNMQVYNRCVGTRYCANNCALKVRRFNWFNYERSDALANLALNPDVTVRSRGVMEKCTFCVQRIEEAKICARNENRPIRDGEVMTACQQSCPAQAITFGNLVDRNSEVAQLKRDDRSYLLLEDLNLQPALTYLAKVRNSEEA
jgi:molybdopterin-containing oxidoreductase family iron-sulfur binding subunit